jgi:hypothetical protein
MASVDAASLTARNDAAMTTPIPRRGVIFTGSIGSVVEYYDFGAMRRPSSLRYFFPSSSPTASLLGRIIGGFMPS